MATVLTESGELAVPGAEVSGVRLGQFLIRHGESEEGHRWLREATRRHPDSWCLWRRQAGVNELGLAALPDFWERVDALGDKRYYAPVDMKDMP